MSEPTLYLIGVPILLFLEICFLMWLVNAVQESSLKLLSAIYVVLISSICLNGIAKFLASYTGMLWGFLFSLFIVFIFSLVTKICGRIPVVVVSQVHETT